MSVSSDRMPSVRAADNELYDRGCDLVEAAAAGRTGERADPRMQLRSERMQRGYGNLQAALSDAERASAAARSLAVRALAAPGAAGPARCRR